MKPLKAAKRLFYSNGAVSTLQAGEAVSFFRHSHLLLGEQAAGSSRLPLVDGAGTVFALAGIAQYLGYTVYGFSGRKPETINSETGFVGQLLDQASCSYFLGSGRRVYSPALMRFYSADPLSPFDRGGLNSYVYCLGDPVNRIDPTGQSSSWLSRLTPKFLKKLSPRYRAKMKAQKESKAKMAAQEAFNKGKENGRELGRNEGYAEAFEAGAKMGVQEGYTTGLNAGFQLGAAEGQLIERGQLRNAALSNSMEGVSSDDTIKKFAEDSTALIFGRIEEYGMDISTLSFQLRGGENITIRRPQRR